MPRRATASAPRSAPQRRVWAWPVAAASLLVLAASCALGPRPHDATPAASDRPPELADGWHTATPASVGLDAQRLALMTAALQRQEYPNEHAVLIERDGRLVYEAYFAGTDERLDDTLGRVVFDRTTKHDVRSISKSVTSALVGIAFGDRADAALDRPLLDFFPEDTDLASPARRAIHLRHALTMSAGLQWEEDNPFADARNDAFGLEHSTDPVRFVLGRAVVAAPGTRFTYSAGLAQLLSAVLQRETGRPLRVYAREALFEPLGITDWEWIGNYAGGVPDAAAGLRLRARDLAKFGSLYLHDGRWNGRQVIPAAWVRASTRRQVTPVERGTLPPGREFGFLWSVDRLPTAAGPLEVHSALGNGGQCVFVLPALRTVVTLLAGRYDAAGPDWSRRLLLERIVPAVVTGARATGGQ